MNLVLKSFFFAVIIQVEAVGSFENKIQEVICIKK